MWIRTHKSPKICRGTEYEDFTAKQEYYFLRSEARYMKTVDGKYIVDQAKALKPEIGRWRGCRFIESYLIKPESISTSWRQ